MKVVLFILGVAYVLFVTIFVLGLCKAASIDEQVKPKRPAPWPKTLPGKPMAYGKGEGVPLIVAGDHEDHDLFRVEYDV